MESIPTHGKIYAVGIALGIEFIPNPGIVPGMASIHKKIIKNIIYSIRASYRKERQTMTESRIRNSLRREGFILAKSRITQDNFNHGGYQILDGYSGIVVEGYFHELTLEDVAAWLAELQREGGKDN